MPVEKYLFCGWPLSKAMVFVGRFVSIMSCVSCALSVAAFFQLQEEEGITRVLYFMAACYSIQYYVICRGLLRGIEEQKRDKILLWIALTVLSIMLLFSGALYECVSHLESGEDNSKLGFMIFSACLVFMGLMLIYFLSGAILLWKSMEP